MPLALQLFKNSNRTQEKLRLNLHSLSVSELLEYGRMFLKMKYLAKMDLILMLSKFSRQIGPKPKCFVFDSTS